MKNKFLILVSASLMVSAVTFAQRPESVYARVAALGIQKTSPVQTVQSVTTTQVLTKAVATSALLSTTSCPSCNTIHFQSFTPDTITTSIYSTARVWQHTYQYNQPLPISTYCGYWNFKEGCLNFTHYADTSYGAMTYWDGFTVSKTKHYPCPLACSNSCTEMYDQFSAMPLQGALGANDPYTVAYYGYNESFFPYNHCGIKLDAANTLCGLYVTNNAYAYKSMKCGDSFARKFTTGDYFLLTIKGYLNGSLTDTVQYCLADYRVSTPYVVNTWKWVNLSALGTVDSVAFELYTTDTGTYGPNTPMYFCMDELRLGTSSSCGTCPATVSGSSSTTTSSSSLKRATIGDASEKTESVEANENTGEQSSNDFTLKVSPNPATTQLTITAPAGCHLQVFDTQGALQYSGTMRGETDTISLSGFKAGVYSVVVRNGSETKSIKFTKQ